VKINDTYVNREERFSLGIEETSAQFYVSFPVFNGIIEYEEYYAIDQQMSERFHHDLASALDFVNRCRRRELDELLMQKPGSNRGSAI
jgi:hypothetical protein